MNIRLRKANVEDSALFLMLWQFYQYHQSSFDYEDLIDNGSFDIDNDYLHEVLLGYENCEVYIIYFDEAIAGFITIEPTKIMNKEMLELSDIFIMPKYRHRGLARFVIEKLFLNEKKMWHVAIYENDTQAQQFWHTLFQQMNIEKVIKVLPAEMEGFHEFVVVNKK